MVVERARISDEKKAWFVEHYPNMRDADLAKELGVCEMTVSRMAKRRGLVKSAEYLKGVRVRAVEAAREANINNPEKIKRFVDMGRKYRFKKGETNLERFGEEGNQKRIEKSVKARCAVQKSERARATFGLPQRTKIKVIPQNPRKARLKWYLTSRGYIVNDEKRTAFYTENTRRGRVVERREQPWYKFEELKENGTRTEVSQE